MAPSRIRARAARAAHKDPHGRYVRPAADDAFQSASVTEHHEPDTPMEGSHVHGDSASWRVNKRDKRTIKHNSLLARVAEGSIQKKPLKRRRPGKKLKTEMSGLADALPEVADGMDDEWEGLSDDDAAGDVQMSQAGPRARRRRKVRADGQGKMVMTSLKHRPGAMRRKMVMEGKEMERFQKNLAQMVGSSASAGKAQNGGETKSSDGQAASQADRWAALRSFIGSTMQQDKAFAGA